MVKDITSLWLGHLPNSKTDDGSGVSRRMEGIKKHFNVFAFVPALLEIVDDFYNHWYPYCLGENTCSYCPSILQL